MEENQNNINNNVVEKKSNGLLVKILICAIVLLVVGTVLYICLDKGVFSSKESNDKNPQKSSVNKNNDVTNDDNDDESTLIDNPTGDATIIDVNTDDVAVTPVSSYVLNGKKVDLLTSYNSIELKETISMSDVTIAVFEYRNALDSYDKVIYAIDKDGNVIWFELPKDECVKANNVKCLSTIGWHFTNVYDYNDKVYKVDGNKLSFVSQNSVQDPAWSACEMKNKNDYFYAEYEIEYLGNNNFSDLKVKRGVTATEYINKNNINCSEQ